MVCFFLFNCILLVNNLQLNVIVTRSIVKAQTFIYRV